VERLAGFAYAPDQVYWIGAPPSDDAQPTLHCFAALKGAAVGSRVSLRSIKSKGWDGSVRGKIANGHFVQGMQHPRIFGWGHIDRGWTNIAPKEPIVSCQLSSWKEMKIENIFLKFKVVLGENLFFYFSLC
jgi:hypothetical protein